MNKQISGNPAIAGGQNLGRPFINLVGLWRNVRSAAVYVLVAAAGLVVWLIGDPFTIQLGIGVCVSAMLALSWDIGHRSGQLSMAQGGFFGTGAYGITLLQPLVGTTAAWIGALVICFLIAVALGSITLRLRRFYFAMATLSFTISMQVVVIMWSSVTGGAAGAMPPVLADGDPNLQFIIIVGFVLIAVLASDYFLRPTRRSALLMIRSHPEVAAASGVAVTRSKIVTFGIAGIIAGLAGATYASLYGFIIPTDVYSFNWSMMPVAAALLGGLDSTIGPLIGAVLMRLLEELARDTIGGVGYQIVYGIVIIVFTFALPGGITATVRRIFSRS